MEYTDFVQNPGKYELFQSARIAKHIFSNNGDADLSVGQHVSIKFLAVCRNHLLRRDEPVYEVKVGAGEFWGYVYANALTNFVL